MSRVAVIIPTLNAGPQVYDVIAGLRSQEGSSFQVVVLDSASTDGTASTLREAGFNVYPIARADFDHGKTRSFGIELSAPSEIVVFLTQDAVPASPDAIAKIIEPFADDAVGLVCGRQLPRLHAGHIESHARAYNYPPVSNVRVMPDAASLGIKAIFNSNSFAAYRVVALNEIGGFPERIIMGEDQVAAAQMLLRGWRVIYQAEAVVRHSHDYSFVEEFRRYFDIGVFHEQQRELLSHFGRAEAEGKRFVWSEVKSLAAKSPHRIPESLARTLFKLSGYKLGQAHRRLPTALKCRLAMNSRYFSG